jgi:hypothetical protein
MLTHAGVLLAAAGVDEHVAVDAVGTPLSLLTYAHVFYADVCMLTYAVGTPLPPLSLLTYADVFHADVC